MPQSNGSKKRPGSNMPPSMPNNKIRIEFPQLLDSNIDLIVYNSDITQVSNADALVSCTGAKFEYGSGISRAITKAAGSQMRTEYAIYLQTHGYLEYGKVHATSAHNMSRMHRYILHVRSPDFQNRTVSTGASNTLASLNELTFFNLMLKSFSELSLFSLAMPLIGTGNNGIPVSECVNDLLDAIQRFRDFYTANPNMYDPTMPRRVYVVNNDPPVLDEVCDLVHSRLLSVHNPKSPKQIKIDAKREEKKASPRAVAPPAASEDCVICMDKIGIDPNNPDTFVKQLDKCGHKFCCKCIDDYFNTVKKVCPLCGEVYGLSYGDQPNGSMTHTTTPQPLPGFPASSGTIMITYTIPSGVQGPRHPNPGKPYAGTTRQAFLPDTAEGRRVLELLRKAFEYKHIFTIGQSRTTGANDQVTWNDIHHKTQIGGGASSFGYPDPTYLSRVVKELAAKGIV